MRRRMLAALLASLAAAACADAPTGAPESTSPAARPVARTIPYGWVARDLDPGAPEESISSAADVNDSGVVVGYRNGLATRWRPPTYARETLPGLAKGRPSAAHGINTRGDVVGFATDWYGKVHAVLWPSAGGVVSLGTLGGNRAEALDVNDHGVVVGWSVLPSGETHAFRWSPGGAMVDVGAGPNYGSATGINDGGTYSATLGDAAGNRFAAYRPSGGAWSVVPLWFTSREYGQDINVTGHVVGWTEVPSGGTEAWIYHPSTGLAVLPPLHPGSGTYFDVTANAVNRHRDVVGYSNSATSWSRFHAALWITETGGKHDLGVLEEGENSTARGINARLHVVGHSNYGAWGSVTSTSGQHAVVWLPWSCRLTHCAPL